MLYALFFKITKDDPLPLLECSTILLPQLYLSGEDPKFHQANIKPNEELLFLLAQQCFQN